MKNMRLMQICIREYCGSQRKLAEELGITTTKLSRKLQGRTPMLLDEAIAILHTMGITDPSAICEICGFKTKESEEKTYD